MSESFGFADVDDLVAGVLFCRPFMGGEVDTTPPILHPPDFPIHYSFCCSKPYGVLEHLLYPIKMLDFNNKAGTSLSLAGISMLTTIPRAVSSQPAEMLGHPGFAGDELE